MAKHLGETWELIGKHCKDPEDEQLLIDNIFGAYHFALEVPAILDVYAQPREDFPRLRRCAEELYAFFST